MLSPPSEGVNRDGTVAEPAYRIQLVEKTFGILEAFDSDHDELSLTQLARRSGQSQSGVYRILTNLVRLGVVTRDPVTKRYRIGVHLYAIGSLAVRDVRRAAVGRMEELQVTSGRVVNLSVRDDLEVVIVEVIEGTRPFRMAAGVGNREPLHATASGKCLLAHERADRRDELLSRLPLTRFTDRTIVTRPELEAELDQTSARGYGLDRGDYDPHYRCLAVPLHDHRGQVCASLSVSGTPDMLDDGPSGDTGMGFAELRDRVVAAGDAISAELGYRRP